VEHPDVDTARLQQLYARRVARQGTPPGCPTPEAVLALLRREGGEHERLATLEHVMSCPGCHREYQWLRAGDEAAVEAGGEPAAVIRPAWWPGAPLALAASIVVVAGVAGLLSSVLWKGADRVRGTVSEIQLVTPGATANADATIAFAWHPLPKASRYVLEVQREDGSVALADTTADTVLTIAPSAALLPDSTYRWWVREASDAAEPRSSALRMLRLTEHR
jgi:hypothetical protein